MNVREGLSPVVEVFDKLRAMNASWGVDIGRLSEGVGWIVGEELTDASSGPLNELLNRIGPRLKTTDRRTIAALYAMRFGWASAMAIAPYLKLQCVPDISIANVSLKFKESTFFERTALHKPRGVMVEDDPRAEHSSISRVPDRAALLQALRSQLTEQAMPVVEALYAWSGFARRGTWGMLTSSWAGHLTTLSSVAPDQTAVLPLLQTFSEGDDLVCAMQPRLHAVRYRDAVHVYQRRASCCRFYLVPEGELCASCPLVSQQDRVARNLAWMQRHIDGSAERRGHS